MLKLSFLNWVYCSISIRISHWTLYSPVFQKKSPFSLSQKKHESPYKSQSGGCWEQMQQYMSGFWARCSKCKQKPDINTILYTVHCTLYSSRVLKNNSQIIFGTVSRTYCRSTVKLRFLSTNIQIIFGTVCGPLSSFHIPKNVQFVH